MPAQAQAQAQDWTLTKTANPTTYSTAGQIITYTYVIINNVSSDGTLFSLTDNKVAAVNCPSTTVPDGGSLTCTGSYVITAADIANGSVTNTATAVGDSCGDGCDVTAQAQATIQFVPPQTGSITIVKSASGGNGSFGFSSSIPSAASFALLTAGGSASRVFAGLTPGTYSFTEVNLPPSWRLATLTCSGDNGGTPTVVNLGARTATVGLDAGEAIVCTFGNVFDVGLHEQRTSEIIARFLGHRVMLLTTYEPDRSRFVRRVPGSLWGGDGSSPGFAGVGGAFAFSGRSGLGSGAMSFATSASRIAQAHADAAAKDPVGSLLAYAGDVPVKALPRRAPPPRSGFDVWIEAHFSHFKADTGGVSNSGSFGIVYVGADYLLTDWLLVGALVQHDWMSDRSQSLLAPTSRVEGRGTMAGPYVSAKLTPNVSFDARFAWGLSDNNIDPFGQYEDSFDTRRWLAHANLTGNWRFGDWRVTPSAGVTYIEERQHSYVDSLGVFIPGRTVSLGRLAVGPEIAYRHIAASGVVLEPHVSAKLVWDFDRPDIASVAGLTVGGDELHARLQAGVLVVAPSGLSLRTVATYDGFGGSFRAIGGQVWLNVPLR